MPPARRCLAILLLCCAACAPGSTQAAPTAALPAATAAVPSASPAAAASPAGTDAPATATAALPSAARAFTEAFDGPAPHWTFAQTGNAQPIAAPQIRDGFLVFELEAPNQWAYALYGGPAYGDVTVEARVQSRTIGDGAAGLVCRYSKASGWYELNVFADGAYQLLYGRWLADGIAGYVPLSQGRAQTAQTDEYTIAVQCSGDTLTPFINGQPQRQRKESAFGLKKGGIGVSVSSFADAPFRIAFDSVKVSEP